jgi:uncharacterized membrane protein
LTLESSKLLGGIGAILMFIGVLPVANYFGIIGFVGIILVLVGLHGLADYYRERGIFNNAIYGIVIGVVGGVVAAAVAIFAVLTSLKNFLYQIYPGWNGDWSTLQGLTPNTSNINPSDVLPFVGAIIVVFVIVWVFAVLATFFIRRSLKQLSAKSNVGLFGTAGLMMLIGAFLIIIFGLGLLLIWIAVLVLAFAFFTLKPQEQPMATMSSPPPPPPTI